MQWQNGYTNRFGIVYVDYNNGYKRYLKASAKFLANLFGTWNKGGPSLLSAASAPAPGPAAPGLIRLARLALSLPPPRMLVSTLTCLSVLSFIGSHLLLFPSLRASCRSEMFRPTQFVKWFSIRSFDKRMRGSGTCAAGRRGSRACSCRPERPAPHC